MADYYPLLARAIEQQPNKGRAAREVIYARARKALLTQLGSVTPPMPEEDIARQQDFLEVAIRRLEADYGARDPEPAPAAPPVAPVAAPVPPAPAPAPAIAPKAETPAAPALEAGPVGPVRAPRPRALEDDAPSEPEHDDLWHHIDRPAVLDEERLEAAAPPPPTASPAARGGTRLIIGAAVVLALIAIGAGLYTQRDRLAGLMGGATTPAAPPRPAAQAPAATPAPDTAKSTDRIAQAPSTAPAQAPAPTQPGVQAAPRALLLEEAAGGGQGLQQFVGKVDWSTETFQPGTGQPQDVGVKAVIDIPDRNFKATMTVRRNPDPNIPASHIVDIQFQLPPDFDYGNVSSVPGMQAMVSETAQGAPLRGLAVRVAPGYFLIGLLSGEREQQYNLGMLFNRGYLNVPVVFENGRRAILVLEKGAAGDQAFRTAFAAWGLLRQPQQQQQQQQQPQQPQQPQQQ